MATTNFYLDTRAIKKGEQAPLKVSITKHGSCAYIPLNLRILPSQWDKEKRRIKDHPSKVSLNAYINSQKQKIDNLLLQMTAEGKLTKMTAVQIKNVLIDLLSPDTDNSDLFLPRFRNYMETRTKERTKDIYLQTCKQMMKFDPKLSTLSFEQITKDWLTKFDIFLSKSEASQNTRSIHFRNIRAVFNDAIDNEVTSHYPFRKFMVRPVATAKRAYSVERLRELFSYPVQEHEEKYVDAFKLIFFLIGINLVDLCGIKEIRDGRIVYQRSKTSRLYSIKVEPEAMEIINKYRGRKNLINFADRFNSVHSCLCTINRALKQIGPREHICVNGKNQLIYHPAFPDLSTYVARHSWATIAYQLEIPNETIAAALGHSYGNQTTAIYINNDLRKVDEANRRVIDYVLGINRQTE